MSLFDTPEGWDLRTLAGVAAIVPGHPFPSDRFTEQSEPLTLPLVRIRDVPRRASETFLRGPVEPSILERYEVLDGDVLVGMDGQFHLARWAGGRALLNQRVAKIEFDSTVIDPNFGFYGLIIPLAKVERGKHYTTVKHLSMGDLRELPVALPSLSEQRAIAHVLNAVQRAREQTSQVIAAARELKRSLTQHLFMYGPVKIRDAEDADFQTTEIGVLPARWEVVPLREAVEESLFGPRFGAELYDSSGNVATLRTTDISEEGRVSYATMPLARLDTHRFEDHLLRAGDVVISRSGTIGITAVFGEYKMPVLPGAFLIRVRTSNRLRPGFLREYFNSAHGRATVVSRASGAVQKNLSGTALKSIPIPLPAVSEQRDGTLTAVLGADL